jgi:AcrR family transcriptional regulator
MTERTFVRHFADKKEILFGDEDRISETLVAAVSAAPPETSPVEAVLAGLVALAESAQARRDRMLKRERIIEQSAELRNGNWPSSPPGRSPWPSACVSAGSPSRS